MATDNKAALEPSGSRSFSVGDELQVKLGIGSYIIWKDNNCTTAGTLARGSSVFRSEARQLVSGKTLIA